MITKHKHVLHLHIRGHPFLRRSSCRGTLILAHGRHRHGNVVVGGGTVYCITFNRYIYNAHPHRVHPAVAFLVEEATTQLRTLYPRL